ncbi:DUF4835 family protein [Sanyastnella coralliicola]|uniref:type IX secretion system protein PorD n=1 Tax=Sanyastnella coralliicola TaxID=3069118 RepID=UPI0027BAE2B5|nr:DUF4835 family protein [Longitalea sp. SCSIO 12813]
MKRLVALSLLLAAFIGGVQAQELNCQVQVQAPQVNNVDPSRFQTLEESVRDFMNSRKWTNDYFELEERIECNILITINSAANQNSFSGSIQIQSSRPVYNSDYKAPVFTVNDGDFAFTFLDNALIQFSIDQHRDNLSSTLAYYAYMIIGMDYDTFSPEGGTEHFLKAQTIVANAQNAGDAGWKASEGQRNRYWLVENILSQTFRPLRACLYKYHRDGFDKLYSDPDGGRKAISDAIIDMRNIHRIKPSSYNVQLFFAAKNVELVKLFEVAPDPEIQRILPVLKELDPGNISRYEQALG